MGVKTKIIAAVAERTSRRLENESREASQNQKHTFRQLIAKGSQTAFGQDHGFKEIKSHKDFVERVPLRDYEGFRPYMEAIIAGTPNVLWPGYPLYLAKTSGTTSGIKYIPITKDSIPNHIDNARDALFNMMTVLKLKTLFDGKMIFLSGSPVLEKKAAYLLAVCPASSITGFLPG